MVFSISSSYESITLFSAWPNLADWHHLETPLPNTEGCGPHLNCYLTKETRVCTCGRWCRKSANPGSPSHWCAMNIVQGECDQQDNNTFFTLSFNAGGDCTDPSPPIWFVLVMTLLPPALSPPVIDQLSDASESM
jgi:hypothetical protein